MNLMLRMDEDNLSGRQMQGRITIILHIKTASFSLAFVQQR